MDYSKFEKQIYEVDLTVLNKGKYSAGKLATLSSAFRLLVNDSQKAIDAQRERTRETVEILMNERKEELKVIQKLWETEKNVETFRKNQVIADTEHEASLLALNKSFKRRLATESRKAKIWKTKYEKLKGTK